MHRKINKSYTSHVLNVYNVHFKLLSKQVGIPVGCVLPTFCLPRGICIQGVCLGCLHLGGLDLGGSAQPPGLPTGGLPSGVCLGGSASRSAYGGWADPLPPVNRMTHRCKNLPCPKLRLRAVKILFSMIQFCHRTLESRKTYHPEFRDILIKICCFYLKIFIYII